MSALAIIGTLVLCVVSAVAGQDSTRTYSSTGVVVYADPNTQPWRLDRPVSTSASVDELMRFGGLSLIQRANGFAGEITMMGLRGAQVTTTIDGMKIHAACVDKMDPNTAYVEIDNVSALQVNATGSDLRYGQTLGGSVNFNLQQPRYGTPLHTMIDGTLESNSSMRRLRAEVSGGTDEVSFRTGYTVRDVHNMVAGNGAELPLSGYMKQNLQAVAGWKPSATTEIEAMMIVDHARDVGYPALLMDTRQADALIGALTWRERWSSAIESSLKLYANRVDHVMDDYDRPVEQIRQRAFMPGMYMPMQGRTAVLGALAESKFVSSHTVIGVIVDATLLRAQAAMDMIPLDTSVAQMHMSNLGDMSVGAVGVAASVDHAIDSDWYLQGSARMDATTRTIHDEQFRSMLSGYYPGSSMAAKAVASSVTLGGTWDATDELQFSLVLGYAQRMPTHLELYGFMIYDPQANIVTNGNPNLINERALSGTLQYHVRTGTLRIDGSMYVRSIADYIAPQLSTAQDGSQPLEARPLMNIGQASLMGADVTATLPVAPWITVQGSLRACRGESITWHDALPLIDPLTVNGRLIMGDPTLQVELSLRAAVAQQRASQRILPEDTTPGWWTANVLVGWQVVTFLKLQLSATNIMNMYYHEHTSINNIPARGRSLNIGLRFEL